MNPITQSSRARRFGTAAIVVALTLVLSGYRYTGFTDRASRQVATKATAWIETKQEADGGFEMADFAGFETPDAVLAIAEEAQTTRTWSTSEARRAVRNTREAGKSPLDYLDDFADAPDLNAGQAAKLIVLVTAPLGLRSRDFNPQGDAKARNLVRTVNVALEDDGSYGAFNATLYAVLALSVLDQPIDPDTLTLIRAGQGSDGGWNYTGNADEVDNDPDTTSLAIQALIAAGAAADDADLLDGFEYLARSQQASGAWQSFGSDDPNSTATGIFAIVAMGYGPKTSCWRDAVAPDLSGDAYVSPVAWLRTQQYSWGRIASPNDGFGVNTFPTAQTVQALRRAWLPVATLPQAPCDL